MVPLKLKMIFLIDITSYNFMEINSIVTRGTFMVIRQIRKVSGGAGPVFVLLRGVGST